MTPEELNEMFEESAMRNCGLTGKQFIERWNSGALRGYRAERVAMLMPLAMNTK